MCEYNMQKQYALQMAMLVNASNHYHKRNSLAIYYENKIELNSRVEREKRQAEMLFEHMHLASKQANGNKLLKSLAYLQNIRFKLGNLSTSIHFLNGSPWYSQVYACVLSSSRFVSHCMAMYVE